MFSVQKIMIASGLMLWATQVSASGNDRNIEKLIEKNNAELNKATTTLATLLSIERLVQSNNPLHQSVKDSMRANGQLMGWIAKRLQENLAQAALVEAQEQSERMEEGRKTFLKESRQQSPNKKTESKNKKNRSKNKNQGGARQKSTQQKFASRSNEREYLLQQEQNWDFNHAWNKQFPS